MKKAAVKYYSEKDGRFHTFPIIRKEVFLGRSDENSIILFMQWPRHQAGAFA